MSRRTFNQSAVVLLTAIMLQACGGGDSGSSPTLGNTVPTPSAESCQAPQAFDSTSSTCVTPALRGQFVDKPVAGLYYETGSGIQGYTDATGSFGYSTANEQVKFSIGKKVDIGYAQAAHVVHVYDLEATQDERLSGVNARRAQVLQSLDANLGKAEVIKLPAGIDQKLPANYVLKYDATQTEFDASLKELLSQADLVAQFVGADAAKTSADSYIVKTDEVCPLKTPASPDTQFGEYNIVSGSLTCLDKIKINFYQTRVYSALSNAINGNVDQVGLVSEAWSDEAAQKAIDTSAILTGFQTVDSLVDAVDSAKKGEVVGAVANSSKAIAFAAQTIVNHMVDTTYQTGGSTTNVMTVADAASASNAQMELVNKVIETLSSAEGCVSALGKPTDKAFEACLTLLSSGVSSYVKAQKLPYFKENKSPNQTEINAAFKVLSSALSTAKSLIKVADARSLADPDALKRASFGLAAGLVKTTRDSIALAYANNLMGDKNDGKEPKEGWAAFGLGVLDNVATPFLNVAKECYGKNPLKPTAYYKCASTQVQEIGKISVKAAFGLVGSVYTVAHDSQMNEAIVARSVIEEFLWAGSASRISVYEKYGVTYDENDSGTSDRKLVNAIALKKHNLQGVLLHSDWISVVWGATWKGQNSFYTPQTIDTINTYLMMIESNANFDLVSPAINVSAVAHIDGRVDINASIDTSEIKASNVTLACFADDSSDIDRNNPIIVSAAFLSFTAQYTTGGTKLIQCSLYKGDHLFAGAKTIGIKLNALPKVQTARSTAPTILTTTVALGETVVGWLGNIATQIASILWEVFDALGHSIYSAVSTVSEAVSITFDTTGDKTIQATYRDASDSTLGQTNTTVTVGAGMAINNITYSPTLQLNQPSTITVTGTDFPETVLLALTNAECGAPFDYYHIEAGTGFSQICTPRTSGEQTLTVKRATGVNAGSVARNANVTNAVLNSITLPDTRNASDFIKLDESGNELSSDASSWACTKDKLTGLIWEIKTKDGSIQDSRGLTSSYGIPSLLDSLNGKKWCGLSNWRMPEQKDLYTLTNFDGTDNEGMFHVENTFFPDWVNTSYYTGYPYGGNSYSYPSMHQFYPKSGMTGTNGSWEGCCYPMQGRMVAGKSVLSADRFEYSPDGSYVYDALLDLTWQRCPIGSKFNNNYCEDTATVMTFEQVKNTLVDNWRLPNAKELVTYGAASYNGTWSSSIFDSSKNLNVVIYGSGDVGYLDTANTQSRATAYLLKSGKQFIGSRYIKISNAGASLPPNAVLGPDSNSWACTKDSQTGLTWEVKTDDGGLRDKDWAYSWYDPNPSTNGGNSGFQNIGYCQGSSCDTASYIAALNPTKLCGYSDWRMPRINELSLLMYNSSSTNSVNQAYFPNSISNIYVSATPSMEDSDFVWIADGNNNGYSHYLRKDYSNYVRAVRSNNP